jgi:cytochrome b561
MTRPHRALVQSSEYALYALLLSQPFTGLLTTLSGGRPFGLFFWRFAPLMSRNETLQGLVHSAHELGAWVLAAAVVGHAAVALFHHFVLRDDVLACMAPVIAVPPPGRIRASSARFPTEAHSGNKREPSSVLPT